MKTKYIIIGIIAIVLIIGVIISLPDILRLSLSHTVDLYGIDDIIKKKVLDNNQAVLQFQKFYPGNSKTYGITTEGGDQFKCHAHFEESFYRRYILSLEVYFNVTDNGKDVSEVGPTKFEFIEFFPFNKNGALCSAIKKSLSADDWSKIVTANGDISAIVPDIQKDKPVEGFRDNKPIRLNK
ncbi:MAG: hypothetical protein WC980_00220 [Candidatus Brocadiia bacterium]